VSKSFKNIAVFCLWLAGLIFMAHQLISHDHHIETSSFQNEGACHSGKSELPHGTSGFPIHCHAFNDLTCEKSVSFANLSQLIPSCDLFFSKNFDPNISNPHLFLFKIKDFQKPLIQNDILRISSFRAPPSLV